MRRARDCCCRYVGKLSLLFLLSIMVSCGPVHQAIQPMADDVRNLKRLAVIVPDDGTFIILLDRATATPAPAVLFGLIGAAIASAHNESRDNDKMTALKPHLESFSTRAAFAEAFSQTLKDGDRQNDIRLFDAAPGEAESKNFDAVLTFNIKNWGLRLPNRDEERLSPFIEMETTMLRASDNKVLWNTHDTFLGQKRSYFSDYKEDGSMLRNELKSTVANAGARMAMKVIYPRGNTK